MRISANTGYLSKLTLVATLGGLLFGYDTVVIFKSVYNHFWNVGGVIK